MDSDEDTFERILKYNQKTDENIFAIKYILSSPSLPFKNEANRKNAVHKYYQRSKNDEKQLQELRKYSKVNMKKLRKGEKIKYEQKNKKIHYEHKKIELDQQINMELKNKRSQSIGFMNNQRHCHEKYKHKQYRKVYEPYTDLQTILNSRAAKQQKYFVGRVQFNARTKWFAKIFSQEIDGILTAERQNRNRCIHNDIVYFMIVNDKKKQDKIYCKIVYIIERHETLKGMIGTISMLGRNRIYIFTPINQNIGPMDIQFNDIKKQWLKQMKSKYFLAEWQCWHQKDQFPKCKIVDQYGQMGNIQIQTSALLNNNSIYQQQYTSEQIQESLQKFLSETDQNSQYKISNQIIASRKDLRNQRIFTIDPLSARDFDDALSIHQLTSAEKQQCSFQTNKKVFKIGVHIADVSFFVEKGSIIDLEAQKRTTSVYLVHRVIPMLPRILCETMCSLNPGLQRLAVSVFFFIDEAGNFHGESQFYRSVIKSKARFTYEQAQQIIQLKISSQAQIQPNFGCIDPNDWNLIAQDIIMLNKLATITRKNRIHNGALSFDIPKKNFKLDDKLYPSQYTIQERKQSNFLVQEFMLMANEKVAQIISKFMPREALLRRHRFPSQKKIKTFQQFMKRIGEPLQVTKNIKLEQVVNKIIANGNLRKSVKQIIKYEMVFLLEQASYFQGGEIDCEDWRHFALNMQVYTHFTSPIRRYADIIVHRQLIAIIQAHKIRNSKSAVEYQMTNIKQIIQKCNQNKMKAKKVSSGCEKVLIFMCLYLKKNPVNTNGILKSVQQWGFNITVPSYDLRTTIELKELKKIKILSIGTDSYQRKYVNLCYSSEQLKFNIIMRELQGIQIKLTSTNTFPIDYEVTLLCPNPSSPTKFIELL